MLDNTLTNARILIVDDQDINNALLESILEHDGFQHLKSLTDPRQVLAQYAEFQPDLILLDLMMPYLDGFAVMQQLRPLIPADTYLPILVLTADVSPEAKRRALSGGAKDFLIKPLDAVEVVLRIRNLLETRLLHMQLRNQNQLLEEKVIERTADLQRQFQRLAALRQIDNAITGNLTLQSTLDVVLQHVTEQLGTDAAVVLLLDPQSQTLTYAAGCGFHTDALRHTRLQLGKGYAGRAAQERQIIHIPDLRAKKTDFLRSPSFSGEGFVVYYGVPLIAKGEVKGVLEVFHRTPHAADDEWRAFLETLAGQTAIAVDNANLFAETQALLRQTQAQAQLTRQIIDSAPEAMIVLDADHRLMLANPTAQAYLPVLADLTPGDVVTRLDGHTLADFLNPVSRQQPWHELTLNQPPCIFEVAAQSLSGGPHAGGWVLVLRDVTVERERQRYEQTQAQLATVGQMADGIAHDFNNIMGAIVLYVKLLSKNADLSDKQQNYLTVIGEQAQHATSLIRQILDFSRRSVFENAALDVLPLVKEMVKLLERTLPENVLMELTYDRNHYVVFGDPTRLQQVFMNLALNARDAMPDGGTLRFTFSTVTITWDQAAPLPNMATGDWVRIAVADTGTGIADQDLPHLFEPFFTTKDLGKGTGLGLAQVYGIITQHDGAIGVESQAGKGTVFSLYLPLHATAALVTPDEPMITPSVGGGETILIVEDNRDIRNALQLVLEDEGYTILGAGDGREALGIINAQAQAIDLVISDMMMPVMGGLDLHRALKKDYPQLKTIIMTGYPLENEGEALLKEGIVDWIQKPIAVEEIKKKIQSALSHQ